MRVAVALPVKLTGAGQRVPGVKMLGNELVQQGELRVARVVELGLAC